MTSAHGGVPGKVHIEGKNVGNVSLAAIKRFL